MYTVSSRNSQDFDALLGIGEQSFRFTKFAGVEDTTPVEQHIKLREMRDLIASTWCGPEALDRGPAAAKAAGPLIKLATFSGSRSGDSMTAATGLELDVDAGTMRPHEAVQRLAGAGIAAIVHSTRKHTAASPRFRVLAPFSEPQPRERRDALTCAVAELLGVDFDPASNRKAQGMFIAAVRGRERFVEIVDGQPVDRCGLPERPVAVHVEAPVADVLPPEAVTDWHREWIAERLDEKAAELAATPPVGDGGGRHDAFNAIAYYFGRRGAHPALIDKEAVREALAAACAENGILTDARASRKEFDRIFNAAWRKGAAKPAALPLDPNTLDLDDLDDLGEAAANDDTAALDGKAEGEAKPRLEWFDDVAPDLSRPYLVKGLLDAGALSCVYGASNAGKTFVVLDMAYHVATGQPWGEFRTRKAAVLYLALEGGAGILSRLAALRKHKHEVTGERVPFAVRRAGANLRKPGSPDVARIVALARELLKAAGDPPLLIVLDTLSRAIPGGEENASADMTAFVANVDKIREATGAHVLIVHHTGKDQAKGMRGHSSLLAAVDHEIQVEHDPAAGGIRYITGGKQRDHGRHGSIPFQLVPVVLGEDSDGEAVTSCAVALMPDLMEDPRVAELPTAGKHAWNALNRLLKEAGGEATGVEENILLDALGTHSQGESSKARRGYGQRGIADCRKAGLVVAAEGRISLAAQKRTISNA